MRPIRPRVFSFVSTHFAAIRTEDRARPIIGPFLDELRRQAADDTAASAGHGEVSGG
jgi:hypothetical protein